MFFHFKTLNIKKRIIEKSDERLARLLQNEETVTFDTNVLQAPIRPNNTQVFALEFLKFTYF